MRKLDVPQIGKMGEEVASRNHYGAHWRKKGHPKRRLTPAKRRSEASMRTAADVWEHLTDEQRQAWDVAGANTPSRKVFGKTGHLSGHEFCSKINNSRTAIGLEPLESPPPQATFGRSPVAGFTISNDRNGLALKLILARAATEEIKVYGSPPFNQGRRRNWDYRVLGALADGAQGANDITQLYVMRFGEPPIGKRIFIRSRQQINGWQGPPSDFTAVVPPRQGGSRNRRRQ